MPTQLQFQVYLCPQDDADNKSGVSLFLFLFFDREVLFFGSNKFFSIKNSYKIHF